MLLDDKLLASWVILHAFFGHLSFFFKINFFKKLFQEDHQSVYQFGSRSGPIFCHARSFVGPDLGANCLQKLLTDDTRR